MRPQDKGLQRLMIKPIITPTFSEQESVLSSDTGITEEQYFKYSIEDPRDYMSFSKEMNFDRSKLPQFIERENKQKGWIEYGADNQYPKYLQSLLSKSPLHSSIVTQKARMIGGYGFITTNLETRTMLFLKNMKADYDLEELLYKCAYDLEIYGAFALNPVWSKDRRTISLIEYVDVSKMRIECPDKEDKYPMIENYWMSDGWENTNKYKPVWYNGFSTKSKKKASQILYTKEQRAGNEYYGLPEYLSAIRWMETDWQVGDFHMNNLKNGMAPSQVITVPLLAASEEEQAMQAMRIKQDLEGTTNAGQWYVQFVDADGQAPTFTPIESNDSDGRFLLLAEQSEKSILFAHRVTNPVLFIGDVLSPGSIGGKNDVLEALELFQQSYLTPKQNLLSKVFNRFARINGITDNLIIKKYSEQFKNVDTNMADIMSVLTSTLSKGQQYAILTQNGYDHETAAKLTEYTEGNQVVKKPTMPIQPIAPNGVKK